MRKIFIFIIGVYFLSSGFTLVSAEVPKTINFQGRLTDKDGKPLAGSYSLKFSLYEAASGGSPLWIEEQTVALSNGLYNCLLGSKTALNLTFERPYYLEINIPTLGFSTRQRLSAVPYALNSERLAGLASTSFLHTDSQGRVGIGTTTPQEKLSVKGNIESYGSYDGFKFKVLDGWKQGWANRGLVFRRESDNAVLGMLGGYGSGSPQALHYLYLGTDYRTPWVTFKSTGNVGIGTTTPQEKLQVIGKVKAKGFVTGDITFTDPKTEKPLWKMFEDEQGLYLKSATTGKVYKFVLEEVKK